MAPMSKNKKKPTQSSKSSKPKASAPKAAKAAPKAKAKPVAKATASKTPLAKKLVKAVSQVFSKPEKEEKKAAKPIPAKVVGKKKKDKKGKDKKDELDLDDDILASDEDMGSEEIPDLSEFEETQEVEETEEEVAVPEAAYTADVPKSDSDEEIYLTDAEGRRYCRVRDCDQVAAVEAYCRYHYLLLWKRIQVRRKILADGKLERYVDELTSRYPDKFLEMIRRDLRTEKDFLAAIAELEIDESAVDNEFEDEAQSYVEEIRGMGDSGVIADEEEF